MGVAETYANYWPAKLNLGKKHPDQVVETASLSSVEPVDITYKLMIPDTTINSGALSALQLESITYASQAHGKLLPDTSRAGFLIGKVLFDRAKKNAFDEQKLLDALNLLRIFC